MHFLRGAPASANALGLRPTCNPAFRNFRNGAAVPDILNIRDFWDGRHAPAVLACRHGRNIQDIPNARNVPGVPDIQNGRKP